MSTAFQSAAAPMDAASFLEHWRRLLRERLRASGTRPAAVAARLHLSESSLRKRFRGEVPFSAAEFVTLCDAYDLPRCPRQLTERWLGFRAIESPQGVFSEAAYIGGLTAFSQLLFGTGDGDGGGTGDGGTGDGSVVELRLCASDLPIHCLLADPVLLSLKLYFFRTRGGLAIGERFDLDATRASLSEVLAQAATLHARYAATDSVEVWGRNPIGSFLHQIKKLAWAHALHATDLPVIFAHLRALAERIGTDADAGRKAGGGAFELYQNRVFTNNAIILAGGRGQCHTFLTVANPHYLHSADAHTYAFFGATVESLRLQADRVGAPGVFDGTRLTRTLHQEIDRVEEAIATYRRAEAMF